MKTLLALILSVGFSGSVLAQSNLTLLYAPTSGEAQIKNWVLQQKSIQKKLDATIRQARVLAAQKNSFAADTQKLDLRDSVSDEPAPAQLRDKIIQTQGEQRMALMEKLPGMQPAPFASCQTLEGCPEAPASFDVPHTDTYLVQDAIAALLRPWMLLQKARGKELGVISSVNDKGRIMEVKIDNSPNATLEVYVSALPTGDVNVSLRGSQDTASFYRTQRQSVLAAIR